MNDKNNTPLPAANLEQNIGNAPMGTEKVKGLDSRVNIHVISYRARNHDPDGISAKAAIDGIVRCGILTDDSAKEVNEVTFKSIIIEKGEKEKTEITISEVIAIISNE